MEWPTYSSTSSSHVDLIRDDVLASRARSNLRHNQSLLDQISSIERRYRIFKIPIWLAIVAANCAATYLVLKNSGA